MWRGARPREAVQQSSLMRGAARPALAIQHHPVLLLARGWQPGALLLISAVLVVIFASAPAGMAVSGLWLIFVGGLFLGGAVWMAFAYLSWSNDRLYLTATRLIEVSGVTGLSEERRELRLEQLQSVEIDFRNPIMRWCGCADLIISITAVGPLRFAAARDPFLVRDRILARLDERLHIREQIDEATVRASVEGIIGREETPLLPENAVTRPRSQQARRGNLRLPTPKPIFFGRQIEGVAWRRHPWFLVRAWSGPFRVLLLGAATPFLLDRLLATFLLDYAGFFTLCLITIALCWMWWRWADWRNDHYVVTPNRLIEIEQLPLGLRQQFSEAALDKVQDIRYRIPNPLASLLNYGDVEVRTASTNQPFIFRGIGRPRQLAAQIDRHVTALRLAEEQGRHDAIRAEFSRWLTTYGELRDEPPHDEDEQPEADEARP